MKRPLLLTEMPHYTYLQHQIGPFLNSDFQLRPVRYILVDRSIAGNKSMLKIIHLLQLLSLALLRQ